jgi:hypothetical protein
MIRSAAAVSACILYLLLHLKVEQQCLMHSKLIAFSAAGDSRALPLPLLLLQLIYKLLLLFMLLLQAQVLG